MVLVQTLNAESARKIKCNESWLRWLNTEIWHTVQTWNCCCGSFSRAFAWHAGGQCSSPCCNRPMSLKQIVTAWLPNARNRQQVWVSRPILGDFHIDGYPVSELVSQWVGRDPPLLDDLKCQKVIQFAALHNSKEVKTHYLHSNIFFPEPIVKFQQNLAKDILTKKKTSPWVYLK